MKKATIDDVARLADVSIKTVSRVLNHEPKVRESTQDRVLEAMEALKYSPNSSARRLAGNRSYLLGLLYDNPSASYIIGIQDGLLDACKDDHYDILIQPCQSNDPGLLEEIEELVTSVRVDGLVLTSPISDMESVRQLLRTLNAPNVVLSPSIEADPKWAVRTNDREICAEMVHYLVSLGHERIAFVMGHPDHKAINERFEGYKDGMRENGLKTRKSYCVQGYNSFDSGVAAARKLLSRKVSPTAIFFATDDMAAGMLKLAHELKMVVPRDLSVVGFDDIPLAKQVWPFLTTIRQPVHDMAKLAGELLIKRLRGESPEGVQQILNSELVIRDSTGPVPKDQ